MQVNINVSENIIDWVMKRVSPSVLSSKQGELLYAWKEGRKAPTYNHIENMSKLTGIPLGYFFLEKPPIEDSSFVEYRTVDSKELSNPSRNLMDTLHDMELIQEWIRNELQATGYDDLSFVGGIKKNIQPDDFAVFVRKCLKIEINWYESCKNGEESFKLLRNYISGLGVVVMMSGIVGNNTHRTLDTNEFRAFALVDKKAPLIFINSNDSFNGKLFSLLHEFAHICLGENSLFNDRYGSIDKVSATEKICNALAAEILVPEHIFLEKWKKQIREKDEEATIRELAKYFKCGYTVLARRAYDQKFIDFQSYQNFARKAVQQYLEKKQTGTGGGDYYNTVASRVDRRFFDLLLGSVLEGRTLYSDAFRLTNTNRSTFSNLAERMRDVG